MDPIKGIKIVFKIVGGIATIISALSK